MANPEQERILAQCEQPDSGCFASDPGSLDALDGFHDSLVRANLESAIDSAARAGIEGVPLEGRMYKTKKLKPNRFGSEIRGGGSRPIISEGSNDHVDIARHRLAACAHACGAAALCPFLISPESNK
jgi:hypothetical protein